MKTIQLSKRVQRIKPSPTMAISVKAAELKLQGKDIIVLGMGEPDFDTPNHIKKFTKEAIDKGQTKYTAVDGMTSLKQAIIDKFKKDNQLKYNLDQILVSCGAKQSCYNVFQALIDTDNEVIIPAPYWVSYPSMALLANGKPIILDTTLKTRFKITPQQLEQAITPKTKLFIFNNPSNPSGMLYRKTELQALCNVLLKHPHVIIVVDDIYEHIVFTKEPFVNLVALCPELYNRTIIINGISKAYAMTGWRIGYAAGPKVFIQAMKKIQSQSTSNPASMSQAGALKALTGDQTCIATMNTAYKERLDYIVDALNKIPGIKCLQSDATFYVFPNATDAIQSLPNVENDLEFADFLLKKAGVAIVPGSAFGCEGYFRLSFAASLDMLKEATQRISAAITQAII